ncbi:V-type ATP synthase subunit D [Embleya sp. NBC_00896]|uniref:V-type ATP synthase subunit D n=1 Tax=Embleya sp. NBC_00896 TaxID=2975961 RepID=UPI002F90C25D|nr:V-type ATP synthase subunit D [Embleya sp. NBC_00896]
MTAVHGSPSGRAVRLRLRRSLTVAERGANLLERKLTILLGTRDRLSVAERHTGESWRAKLSEAETWLLRGRVLGGERMAETAWSEIGTAEITVAWVTLMGVRYPAHTACAIPLRAETGFSPGNTALVNAEQSYREALQAAADHAAALLAARRVENEIRRARRRVRALRRHWIPRLDDALKACELGLEQQELDEAARRRKAFG